MRATTDSVVSRPVPRLFVLGCALAVVAGCSGSSGGSVGSTDSAPTGTVETTTASPTGSGGSTGSGSTSPSVEATVSDVPSNKVMSTPPGGQVFEIFVAGRRVEPKPSRHTVRAGETVRIIVTTDKANVVHVHGADVEREIKPRKPLTIDFTIKDPGVYPIELHEPELLLTQFVVR